MNKSIIKSIFLSLIICFISAFAQPKDKELGNLAHYLQGIYSTELQAKADSDFFHISLKIFPIWKEKTDSYWFYIEQAVAGYEKKPYRQRIYRLTRKDDITFESAVFTFNDPLRFVGDIEKVNRLLTTDSLQHKVGCSVFLVRTDENYFTGSTNYKDCPSEIRNAKYASSEVLLYINKLISWDRGFDENGKQVWGATKGGYVFDKIINLDDKTEIK